MGSYDTSETISRSSYESSPSTSRRSEQTSYSSRVPLPSDDTPQENVEFDYDKPTLVSLGGGLTPARIVKKVDAAYITKKAIEVVKYLISDEVAVTKEEKNIADAVKERMQKSDYRAIINDHYNFHNEHLHRDQLKEYLEAKERISDGGVSKYNFTDIAIVTHEEGGVMSDLEKKLKA